MRRNRPSRPVVVALATLSLVAPLTLVGAGPVGAAVTACSGKPNDINGDGYADVAVGEPGGGGGDDGRLHVFYGTAKGLATAATGDAPDDQVFRQGNNGVRGLGNPGDGFGSTVLVDDFNGDGCADVAAALQYDKKGTGSVIVLYGSIKRLRGGGSQLLDQDDAGAGQAAANEQFGAVLAAGDFNGDGVRDLAVGSPIDDGTGRTDAGAVTVFYGSPKGFRKGAGPDRVIDQDLLSVPGSAETGDQFGGALAAGDLTGDGIDDLAVGVPGENGNRGTVQVLPGGPGGLGSVNGRTWSQDTPGVADTAETKDFFGWALAIGDVDGDGGDDLVVGVPGENTSRGGVQVLSSAGARGITAEGSALVSQDTPGVAGVAAAYDVFGWAVAVAPLDGDRFADIVLGTPFDNVPGAADVGSVTLLRGSATGPSTAGYGGTLITQASPGVAGSPEASDVFGYSVAVSPVQGNGVHQVLVGVPGEDVGTRNNAGQSVLLRTTSTGPTGTSQTLGADTAGVAGTASSGAGWGAAVN